MCKQRVRGTVINHDSQFVGATQSGCNMEAGCTQPVVIGRLMNVDHLATDPHFCQMIHILEPANDNRLRAPSLQVTTAPCCTHSLCIMLQHRFNIRPGTIESLADPESSMQELVPILSYSACHVQPGESQMLKQLLHTRNQAPASGFQCHQRKGQNSHIQLTIQLLLVKGSAPAFSLYKTCII